MFARLLAALLKCSLELQPLEPFGLHLQSNSRKWLEARTDLVSGSPPCGKTSQSIR